MVCILTGANIACVPLSRALEHGLAVEGRSVSIKVYFKINIFRIVFLMVQGANEPRVTYVPTFTIYQTHSGLQINFLATNLLILCRAIEIHRERCPPFRFTPWETTTNLPNTSFVSVLRSSWTSCAEDSSFIVFMFSEQLEIPVSTVLH